MKRATRAAHPSQTANCEQNATAAVNHHSSCTQRTQRRHAPRHSQQHCFHVAAVLQRHPHVVAPPHGHRQVALVALDDDEARVSVIQPRRSALQLTPTRAHASTTLVSARRGAFAAQMHACCGPESLAANDTKKRLQATADAGARAFWQRRTARTSRAPSRIPARSQQARAAQAFFSTTTKTSSSQVVPRALASFHPRPRPRCRDFDRRSPEMQRPIRARFLPSSVIIIMRWYLPLAHRHAHHVKRSQLSYEGAVRLNPRPQRLDVPVSAIQREAAPVATSTITRERRASRRGEGMCRTTRPRAECVDD